MPWKALQRRHFSLGFLPSFVNSLASADPLAFILPVLQGLLCLHASLWGAADRAQGINLFLVDWVSLLLMTIWWAGEGRWCVAYDDQRRVSGILLYHALCLIP